MASCRPPSPLSLPYPLPLELPWSSLGLPWPLLGLPRPCVLLAAAEIAVDCWRPPLVVPSCLRVTECVLACCRLCVQGHGRLLLPGFLADGRLLLPARLLMAGCCCYWPADGLYVLLTTACMVLFAWYCLLVLLLLAAW